MFGRVKNYICLTVLFVLLFEMVGPCVLPLYAHESVLLADSEVYTYQLTQSTAGYQLWTTPPSERVFKDSPVPTASGAEVKVYAAQNEFEPFQVVVNPAASGNVNINIGDFGSGITSEIYQVKYVYIDTVSDSLGRTGDYPDPLWPIEKGASVALLAGENTSFWFSLFVPPTTPSGDYTTNVQVGTLSVPVTLHVFDFAIPDELHVKSQMNFSHSTVLDKYSVPGTSTEYWFYVDALKQYFIDHRLTSKSPLWPGGVTSNGGASFIDYDCATETLSDPHGIWGFEHPANKYLNGDGFNDGTGYPSFMAATFRNNDSSADQRPSSFCGIDRSAGDWYTANNPSSAYNQKWFAYIGVLQNYLSGLGYLDKSYYYFANEPQDQADYDAVAWYSQELKKAAPNWKLMVSEEPKPEIYDHPTFTGAKVDIWLPVLQNYDPLVSQPREKNHGEETWIYFLHGTRPPYFNPITLDHPGIEGKLTGWFLWKYRVRGLAYYSLNSWSVNPWTDPMTSGHNGDTFMLYPPSQDNQAIAYGSNNHRFVPSIRFELMRDSLEDYEYLYVLSGGQPEIDLSNTADPQVDKIISGLTSYTRNSEFIYNLRRLIGLKNGGEITTIPDIEPPTTHPRAAGAPGNYYLNFQDPAGEPSANPLIVNGKTYLKIGSMDYSDAVEYGYGWFSPPDANWETRYISGAPNELQNSLLFSDWGRPAVFEFDLPNGSYNVTLSVGWQGRTYSHHKVDIEGVSFVNDEGTTPSASYIVRAKQVQVSDKKLTLAMGIFNEYTMLNYVDIEAINPAANFVADKTMGDVPLTVSFTDLSTNAPTGWEWDFDNDGSVESTLQHPTHTYTETGTYAVKLRVTNPGGGDVLIRDDYITVNLPAVHDLDVLSALTDTHTLTATLAWTPLADAVTTTLRYSTAMVSNLDWNSALLLTSTLPGTQYTFTASLPYQKDTYYFVLKSQFADDSWSGLSNVAFWPRLYLYLPTVLRAYP